MAKLIASVCMSLFCCLLLQAQGMHPQAQIDGVRRELKQGNKQIVEAYEQLIVEADKALEIPDNALEDFCVPGRYIDADRHRKNSMSLQIDAFNAYACALAYRLSDKELYGYKACELLNAWARVNKSYSEYDGSLVMAYSGTGLMNAALLMQQQAIWREADKEHFAKWVEQVYNKSADEIRYRKNNWGDWGRYASLLSACYLNNKDEIRKNTELIKSDLPAKIASDGSMPEEVKRGENGIWYTYFALAPITASAWIIYNEIGEDVFHQQIRGASLKRALDYLLFYSKNPEKWPHFPNPNKPAKMSGLDVWPSNLFEAMGDVYGDSAFEEYAIKNRPIIYRSHHFAWTFPTLMPCELIKH